MEKGFFMSQTSEQHQARIDAVTRILRRDDLKDWPRNHWTRVLLNLSRRARRYFSCDLDFEVDEQLIGD